MIDYESWTYLVLKLLNLLTYAGSERIISGDGDDLTPTNNKIPLHSSQHPMAKTKTIPRTSPQ